MRLVVAYAPPGIFYIIQSQMPYWLVCSIIYVPDDLPKGRTEYSAAIGNAFDDSLQHVNRGLDAILILMRRVLCDLKPILL
jgi:hypothetical protein